MALKTAEAIASALLSRIRDGEFQSGRLPAERALSEAFSTTRITLREALGKLEAQGMIYRELRRGWFIAPPRLVYNPLHHSHFHAMATEQGRRATTEVIAAGEVAAQDAVATALGLAPGSVVYCIRRLRRIDGRAVLYVEHYLNPHFFPGLLEEDLTRSLTDLYDQRYGIRYGGARFTILPGPLPDVAAPALNVATGSPGLLITRINRNQQKAVIDCDCEYWRYDALCVDVEA
ncbi:UTRA domain-containing protein [Pantoea sp. M_8]|uniref:UTRA domain-containing protein n=1 Tax=Pantoea anthophila TaxID=470931 RepID=A0ABY2ZH98_9GAMM|nr:UTRA domain-containing protein [Pantoea sp. M_6]KAA5977056.1 UTRA domain-containing protein [Pantoea sp. M_8]KAA5991096.1 UTRA domain-containing protein [Pantoea sp. M_10]KAA5997626.1 UTRA domain-containing protein [Pantoea sp. M_5]PZL85180.1 UTRA domain-containing protein [Pantoea sp. ARC270]TPV34359.1 UTRA domain-containing protein [Pantoea anthophila]